MVQQDPDGGCGDLDDGVDLLYALNHVFDNVLRGQTLSVEIFQ